MAALGIDRSVGKKNDSFVLEETSFSFHGLPVSFSAESTDGEVAFHDPVAGSVGSKRISAQSLSDGLGGPAGDIVAEQFVGAYLTAGNEVQGVVDLAFEFRRGT